MKAASINVGRPRTISWRDRTFTTSILKEPVKGPVRVGKLGLTGDTQSDLKVHGGPDKAVYFYALEHYEHWATVLERDDLGPGGFGENVTTDGLAGEDLAVGTTFRIGTAELAVTEPRLPCVKLTARMQRADIGKLFMASLRTGFYAKVNGEGEVSAGDVIEILDVPAGPSIRQLAGWTAERSDVDLIEMALQSPHLTEGWRNQLEQYVKA